MDAKQVFFTQKIKWAGKDGPTLGQRGAMPPQGTNPGSVLVGKGQEAVFQIDGMMANLSCIEQIKDAIRWENLELVV